MLDLAFTHNMINGQCTFVAFKEVDYTVQVPNKLVFKLQTYGSVKTISDVIVSGHVYDTS